MKNISKSPFVENNAACIGNPHKWIPEWLNDFIFGTLGCMWSGFAAVHPSWAIVVYIVLALGALLLVLAILGAAWAIACAGAALLWDTFWRYVGKVKDYIFAGFFRLIFKIFPFLRPRKDRQKASGGGRDYSDEELRNMATAFVAGHNSSHKASEDDGLNDFPIRYPKVTFKNVHGMTELKKKLAEHFEEHKKAGKNGFLFSGEPGNGKTFIAEAFAGEIGYAFMPVTIGDIKSKWVGQTTEQLTKAFRVAAQTGKCVLFLDEVDSLIKDRSASSGNAEDGQVTNAFLTEIVNLRRTKVIVVAATNYPDMLDRAAIREGRFDFKIEIKNPDMEARLGLLNKFSGGVNFSVGTVNRLAERWEGFSAVRIREIAERIGRKAREQHVREVDTKFAMSVLRDIQGSSGFKLPENTKSLSELHFDEKDRARLISLASRMENIEEVEAMGGTLPKGVLFFGPPGTGKTAAVKALAKDSRWVYLPTSGQALLSDPGEVDKLVSKARDLRPCIVFIDEADDILHDRASNPYGKASTNKLLALMDGSIPLHDVMFVAATNFVDAMDAAAVRGGRFSEQYEFKKPEANTIEALVREWMSSKPNVAFGFTPEIAAGMLAGFAPSDIRDVLQRTVNLVVGRKLSGQSGDARVELSDLATMVAGVR